MALQQDPNESSNSYMIDHESAAEMARLLHQDHTFTEAMGGLLSERGNDFSGIKRVLDAGCGPGGWTQEVAFAHQEIEVIGIDISETMINYARAQAKVQGLDNLRFQIMDMQQPLAFPDNSFDLVNARLLGFFTPSFWPQLVQEYLRITRPGGLIRLTETEMSISNSPALEQEHSWFFHSMWKAGQSFSSNGERLTITAQLAPLLRRAGCHNMQVRAYAIDWSFGTPNYEAIYQDMKVGLKLMEPYYLATGVATQEEMDKTYQQMLIEVQQESFAGAHYLLTASGEKPE
jgi:ubiquinone/menaquinone biosynthesis C-methylase UbiE